MEFVGKAAGIVYNDKKKGVMCTKFPGLGPGTEGGMTMKRVLALFLLLSMLLSLTGCTGGTSSESDSESSDAVTLRVVTSFGGDDGNRANYKAAVTAYEVASGNRISDSSEASTEEWKSRVMQDFETGSEPDVLFYFNGADSNAIVFAGLVVPIEEIRAVYPEYAGNIKEEMLVPSAVDGKSYAVPVSSYAEVLYVNRRVLEASGVEVPGADYTWEQFLQDCEKVKEAGYVPIAASLQEVPHYLFEYCVYNEGSREDHLTLPLSSDDETGRRWVRGLNTIRSLYEAGYFPENTLTAGDAETVQLLADGQAAFLIDGTWRLGFFRETCRDHLDDFAVAYVPGTGNRAATDLIGGISMGYYITRKAWENPKKRDAAVRFVEYMTSDAVVSTFATYPAATPLKNGVLQPEDVDALQAQAVSIIEGATSMVGAVQDLLTTEARGELFAGVTDIVTEKNTAESVVDHCVAVQEP